MSLRYLLVAGSLFFAANANAVVTLTLTDVSDKDSNNPDDIQCIMYGNSCPGGFQDMSALNYAQGGNPGSFDLTATTGTVNVADSTTNQVEAYTVAYIESYLGSVFNVGIDVNTAGGQPPEQLQLFQVLINGTVEFEYVGPGNLDPAFNGNGYFDFVLSTIDLTPFADGDTVAFRASWTQATDGAENFFVFTGELPPPQVPEPATTTLLLSGLLMLGAGSLRRKRRARANS